jgi:hypothetical protein
MVGKKQSFCLIDVWLLNYLYLYLGSFIALPAIGSGNNTITVYAENRVNVERTLRSLNYLVCMNNNSAIASLLIQN